MRWQYIAHVTPSDGAMTPSDGVTQRHVRGATDPTLLRCNVSAERYGSLRPGACSGSGSGACCWSFSIQIEEPNGAVKRRARPSRKRHREKMYYYCGECGGRLTAPGACAERRSPAASSRRSRGGPGVGRWHIQWCRQAKAIMATTVLVLYTWLRVNHGCWNL